MGKLFTKQISTNHKKKYDVRVEYYESTSELSKDLNKREMKAGGWHKPDFSEWTGIESREQLDEFLTSGYNATVKNLKDKVKITARGNGKRISFQNNVQGFAPVVPLAMMNIPNNMISMQMKPIKNKVIDVYYDITCPCSISSEQILKAGEDLLGAILELEHSGYKFNLYAVQTYSDSKDCDMLVVKIKSSDKPFDLKRMSFSLTHTGFFSVVGFDWYSKCPTSTYKGGYGHLLAREVSNINEAIKEMWGQQAICFSSDAIINQRLDQQHIKEVLQNAGTGKNNKR